MRPARGFSLLELGIVLAVAAILTLAAASTATGFYQNARDLRTSNEMTAMATAGANAVKRGLSIQVGSSFAGTTYTYSLGQGFVPGGPISNLAPQCYDLHAGPCTITGSAGPAAFVPAGYPAPTPVTLNNPIVTMMSPGAVTSVNGVYNNGYNAWCEPYVVCVFPARADVITCVPTADVNTVGLQTLAQCGACPAGNKSPVTQDTQMSCVIASASATTKSDSSFAYSVRDFTYTPTPGFQGQLPQGPGTFPVVAQCSGNACF
jgi:prepilin-type N-terminal cleavage/methylation domain-containing protein